MDALVLKNGTMSSVEIAELTGKPHNDVMKAIRAMEPAWKKINGGSFPWLITPTKKVRKDLVTNSTKQNAFTSLPSLTMRPAQNWFSAGKSLKQKNKKNYLLPKSSCKWLSTM